MAVLLLITAFFSFYDLGRRPLAEWDESTNTQVVLDSVHSSRPWDLQLQGNPFFEKTPLWYYATELSVSVFGESNFALRLVSALAGFLLIISTIFAGWKIWGAEAGLLAGAVLLSTPHLWVQRAAGYFTTHTLRSADVDSLQMLFILISWYATWQVAQGRLRWLTGAAGFSALGVMAKGPLGLLPLVVLGLYVWGPGRDAKFCVSTKLHRFALACATFALIVLPWYFWMLVRYGVAFSREHFGYHLLQRVGVTLENHSEHWWFYLKLLADPQVFPGCFLFLLALAAVFRKGSWRADYAAFSLCLITIGLVVLLTLAQTRIAWYVLPFYPFGALLTGSWLARQRGAVMIVSLGLVTLGILASWNGFL